MNVNVTKDASFSINELLQSWAWKYGWAFMIVFPLANEFLDHELTVPEFLRFVHEAPCGFIETQLT